MDSKKDAINVPLVTDRSLIGEGLVTLLRHVDDANVIGRVPSFNEPLSIRTLPLEALSSPSSVKDHRAVRDG
jgi:hypothetical protein